MTLRITKMASIIYHANNEVRYNIPDMEFSAFFDLTTNNLGDRIIYLKYFLFIKYKEKIYVEVKSVGYIIMPFEEFMKNKLLKMYYELSLLLVKDKNIFVEKISDEGHRIWDDEITDIYKGQRNCFVDCAYILNGVVKTDKQYCYYEINPFEWKDPYSLWVDPYTGERKFVNTPSEIEWFNYNFKVRLGYELSSTYKKRATDCINLVINYNISLIEKELDEISAIEYDKQNIIKLIAFNDKVDMNSNIFEIIYNNLINSNRQFKYNKYINNLYNNDLTYGKITDITAQIILN